VLEDPEEGADLDQERICPSPLVMERGMALTSTAPNTFGIIIYRVT
jgi:hypothetical protein